MASVNGNWYAPAPTMLAQQPSSYFDNSGDPFSMSTSPPKSFANGPRPSPSFMSIPMRPHAGRKRSRDEISGMLDDGSALESLQDRPPSPPKKPAVEPVYGPGMSLIYPQDAGLAVDAGSQSGTWVEERAETSALGASLTAVAAPEAESRKSQRLNGDVPGLDDIALAVARDSPRSSVSEPIIDEATRTLGIGWKEMPGSMEAAARGWARFIENHYPLQSVNIFWQNKALPAYLARAVCYGSPGYYLFDEDLDRGQLVAKSWEKALDNLRESPPIFDGDQILTAHRASVPGKESDAIIMEQASGMDID